MKTNLYRHPFLTVMALLLALPTLAAPVTIDDEPPSSTTQTPINLLLLADDSGSMTWTHTPEGIGEVERACWRSVSGILGGGLICSPLSPECSVIDRCGYPYQNPYPTSNPAEALQKAIKILPPPLTASGFNNLSYNPSYTYLPPVVVNNAGQQLSFPSMNAANTQNWNVVGWPDDPLGDHSIVRPEGVPVNLNFRKFTDPNLYQSDTSFIRTRSFLATELAMISYRYLGALSPDEIAPIMAVLSPSEFKPVPLHYYRTSVKWCRYYQSLLAMPDQSHVTPPEFYEGTLYDGSASPEDCQADYSETYKYPYYYYPNGDHYTPPRTNHTQFPAFEFHWLNYSADADQLRQNVSFDTVVDGQLRQITRSYAEELENYANWYAYYSNRTAATRTVASLALAGIRADRSVSFGFSALNKNSVDVSKLNSASAQNSFAAFKKLLEYGVSSSLNPGTPLKTGVEKVRTALTSVPLLGCERNYTIALTDGMWNDDYYPGDFDRSVTQTPPFPVKILGTTLTSGTLWPYPIQEGLSNTSNTLADVSLSAWLRSLKDTSYRSDTARQDPALWSHLNLIALAYGAEGMLPNQLDQQDAVLGKIRRQELAWTTPVKNVRSAADDLWHATITGFGSFTASTDPADYATAIEEGSNAYQTGLNSINNRAGTASAPGIPTNRDGSRIYFASYLPGWSGDVTRYNVPASGSVNVNKVLVWQAANAMADRMENKDAWKSRKIFTASPTTGIDFQWDSLSNAQKATLGTDEAGQKLAVAYLRGDESQEMSNDFFSPSGVFRARDNGVLGDFVHAAPVVSDPPAITGFNYNDNGYNEFKTATANRPTMIYAAGNDGMVHAFVDSAGAQGKEAWAFIPPELFRSKEQNGIVNLANASQDWKHKYYVDATPRESDADFNAGSETATSPDWRTLLVGGMGKGGTSYYALDVSSGDAVGQENFLWTFTNANLGYTYGRPIIAKTNNRNWSHHDDSGALISSRWLAILPSGLNNGKGADQLKITGNGNAYLYFVSPKDGTLQATLEVPEAGDADDPLGLVHISGYVKGPEDQTVTEIYGGDQHGHVWRFDLADQNASLWSAKALAKLTSASTAERGGGDAQPVNTEPRFEVLQNGANTTRWVLVGTGRFYSTEDLYDFSRSAYPALRHSMYALKDGDENQPESEALPIKRDNLINISDTTGGVSSAQMSDKRGWVEDLPEGYQIFTNPDNLLGAIAYSANKYIPPELQTNPCSSSPFVSRTYVRQIASGKSLIGSGTAYYELNAGITYTMFVHDSNGKYFVRLFTDTQEVHDIPVNLDTKNPTPGNSTPRRSSIRYINNQ